MIRLSVIKKILITNIVSLNPGDAAILYGTINILRKKYGADIEVVVFDRSADVAQKYYPWASFRQSLFPTLDKGRIYRILETIGYSHWAERFRFLRFYLSLFFRKHKLHLFSRLLVSKYEANDLDEYLSADLILSTGGTYLIENYDLSPVIRDYRLSLLAGNYLGFFTQTLGPFRNEKYRKTFKNIFSNASVILLRDARSKKHIEELGVDSKNLYLAADAAFALVDNKMEPLSSPDMSYPQEDNIKLAISVRSMKNFYPEKVELYYEGVVQAIQIAVQEFGAEITFLSTCQGIDEYWTNDDITADEIYALIPDEIRDNVKIDREFRQPWEIIDKYKTFDAVIATRMHAAILSLCAGTPTLGLAYEFKMEELFKNIGMDELVINIGSFKVEDITLCVQQLLNSTEIYKSQVYSVSKRMCKLAWSAEQALPNVTNHFYYGE